MCTSVLVLAVLVLAVEVRADEWLDNKSITGAQEVMSGVYESQLKCKEAAVAAKAKAVQYHVETKWCTGFAAEGTQQENAMNYTVLMAPTTPKPTPAPDAKKETDFSIPMHDGDIAATVVLSVFYVVLLMYLAYYCYDNQPIPLAEQVEELAERERKEDEEWERKSIEEWERASLAEEAAKQKEKDLEEMEHAAKEEEKEEKEAKEDGH